MAFIYFRYIFILVVKGVHKISSNQLMSEAHVFKAKKYTDCIDHCFDERVTKIINVSCIHKVLAGGGGLTKGKDRPFYFSITRNVE